MAGAVFRPGLEAVRSEAGTGEQEVQVVVNRDRASQLGLTTQDVAMTVAGAMRGDRLPKGSWNTICMSRRSARRASPPTAAMARLKMRP